MYRCPNCEATMDEGSTCPECEHSEDRSKCFCASCYANDIDAQDFDDSERFDDTDADDWWDDEPDVGGEA